MMLASHRGPDWRMVRELMKLLGTAAKAIAELLAAWHQR
jgi:hypothetical protein